MKILFKSSNFAKCTIVNCGCSFQLSKLFTRKFPSAIDHHFRAVSSGESIVNCFWCKLGIVVGRQFPPNLVKISLKMLSRVALLSVKRPMAALATRAATSTAPAPIERQERPINPSKVRMGFVPEEWFQFFYNKTGVTGPYTFGVGLLTYLCSKEIYVMEHEYYTGLSVLIMSILVVKKLGPSVAKYADHEIDKLEDDWKEGREAELKALADTIAAEKKEQWRAEGALMLMDAKKENIALQLEAAFRERAMNVYTEVKRRLDYQVECRHIERRLSQKHMVNWIINNVLGSITATQEKETLNKCIADLSALAARVK